MADQSTDQFITSDQVKVMAQIFISYAREDEEKVENLYRKLSDAGFKPWMDKKDILPGEIWELSIQQAIRNSHFFLACLSTKSVKKRGVLQREMKEALDFKKEKLNSDIYIIPARLEECEIPDCLRQFQYVNLFEDSGWALLMAAIHNGMELQSEDKPDAPEPVLLETVPIYERPSYDIKSPDSKSTIKVEMTFNIKLEQFDKQFRTLLIEKLASFLDISPEVVLITSIRKGSVKVTIELPTQSAKKLLNAYKKNDPELMKHLAPLTLVDFRIDRVEPERISMSKVSGTDKRKPSTAKKIIAMMIPVLQIIDFIFRISQTLAKELGLPYTQAIFYFVFIIMSLLMIFFLVSYKKWRIFTVYILSILILAILINPIKNRIEKIVDSRNQFEKSDQTMAVIISDFNSPIAKDGANFAESLYIQLTNKIIKPLEIPLGDTTLSLEIKVQKVEGAWDTTKMKIRGSSRKADLGIIGNYRHYLEQGERKEIISDFKVIILDTLIAPIFKEKKPYGDIYEFIIKDIEVTQRDSVTLEEKASLPIEYIINMAGDARLLQRATRVNGWNRNQTLSILHQRLTVLGKLINNRSLACFHHGNSLVRAAMKPRLPLADQRELFTEASNAYKSSIRSFSVSDSSLLKQYHPERIYLNLAWSYVKLDSCTGISTFKDSAEAVYDSVVVRYPKLETLQEQQAFLEHRCEEEFIVKKDTSRIDRAEQLYNKYKNCADKLEIEIRAKSRTPSKEDQRILDTIDNNKKNFEAHLKKLRQLRQGV